MHSETRMTSKDRLVIPAQLIPSFRTSIAIQNKVERNLLFRTWGGVGDQICAEPTLRFAIKSFLGCDVSLSSERPELFRHLNFKDVFDEKKVKPLYGNYLLFETITPPDDSNLVWQFFSHMLTNCVDFPALCALRSQLPVSEREIFITGDRPSNNAEKIKNGIFVHPGRHWPSKTFPKDWWDETLAQIIKQDLRPILIGGDTDDNRGTVDVHTGGCIDLRNKLTFSESAWLLQRAKVLLTNDSSPLHMAASSDPFDPVKTGYCQIKYIATCKHPDFITHWRKGQWQYREENLGLGGMWDTVSQCPNQDDKVTVDKVDEELLRTWLPTPESVALSVRNAFDKYWVI